MLETVKVQQIAEKAEQNIRGITFGGESWKGSSVGPIILIRQNILTVDEKSKKEENRKRDCLRTTYI